MWGTTGSLLGPILLISFTTPLQSVIENHNVLGVFFAGDTQVVKSFKLTKSAFCEATIALDSLFSDVVHWMTLNGLKINPEKTEVLLHGTAQGCAKFQEIFPEMKVMFGSRNLPISTTCRNLGFWFDAQLSRRAHASQVTCKCMFNLKRLRRVRRQLDDDTTETVMQALVHSQLDYGSSILINCPAYVMRTFQKIQNEAARVLYHLTPWSDERIIPYLKRAHWLKIPERIEYR